MTFLVHFYNNGSMGRLSANEPLIIFYMGPMPYFCRIPDSQGTQKNPFCFNGHSKGASG